jgi:hypothetical protein
VLIGAPSAKRRTEIREALAMIVDGKGASYVARLFKVDRATLYRALKKAA